MKKYRNKFVKSFTEDSEFSIVDLSDKKIVLWAVIGVDSDLVYGYHRERNEAIAHTEHLEQWKQWDSE